MKGLERVSSERKRDLKSTSKLTKQQSVAKSIRSSVMEQVDIQHILETYNNLKGTFETKELPSRQLHLRRFG